jgi:MGT family glycosyltransferase
VANRFLIAMWDGGGNVPPFMGVARRLVARGHSVHILGDPTLEAETRATGAIHLPWTAAPHRKTRRREDDVIRDYEISNPIRMIRNYVDSFVGRPAPDWASDTERALRQSHADVLVGDMSLPAAFIPAEKLGIAAAACCPNIWILPTRGIPPIGMGFLPAAGPIGQARDWVFRGIVGRALSGATPHINGARATHGLPPVANIHEQMTRTNVVYVLTSPVFDFTSPAMPAHVRYAGPILDDPDWCEPWQSPWKSDDPRPLVLVGLSSTFQDQLPVLKRIAEAVSQLEVRALITSGPSIDPRDIPAGSNAVVVRSASHTQVLPAASLLITHCGHGTTMRGLAAGVPLLCLPMGRDQDDTAARVVHHGTGVRLSPKASAENIRASITKVLDDPAYRARAARLGKAIQARTGCVDIVEGLEGLANRRDYLPTRWA